MTSTSPLDFAGKNALVVGGSSGLGNGIAQLLQNYGANCHVTGTKSSGAEYADETSSDLDGLQYHQLDLSDDRRLETLNLGSEGLDVLVLSQGITFWNDEEFNPNVFRQVIDINLVSIMSCCDRFFEDLKRRKGTIVIINSIAAYRITIGLPAYTSAKAGADSLTKSLAEAWGKHGIRVNGLASGFVETKMTRDVMRDPARRERYLRLLPLERFASVEDVANVALFLASPLASYITGQTIVVDGGKLLR